MWRICAPFHLCQAERFDDNGDIKETVAEVKRGRMYAQCLLYELELGDFDTWVDRVSTGETQGALRVSLNPLFIRLHEKVKGGESWTNLPDGSSGGSERTIAQGAPKLIGMAIRRAVDKARLSTTGEEQPD